MTLGPASHTQMEHNEIMFWNRVAGQPKLCQAPNVDWMTIGPILMDNSALLAISMLHNQTSPTAQQKSPLSSAQNCRRESCTTTRPQILL